MPTAADSQKTFTATCKGADGPSQQLLGLVPGSTGSLAVPIVAKTTAPVFVEPGQSGIGVESQWSITIGPELAGLAAGIAKSATVSNANIKIFVEGPADASGANPDFFEANPPAQTVALDPAGITSSFPPIGGALDNVGNAGVVKLKTVDFTFTMKLNDVSPDLAAVAGNPINLTCGTGTVLASIPVKIAGSPDIVQPIELQGTPGQDVTVDVLGQYVTNGKTKDGVEQQVDPSTLKIVDGNAKVVNGQVVVTSPEAGQAAEATFEVCAGTVEIAPADPGTSEVQEITFYRDTNNGAWKKTLGARFSLNGEVGPQTAWIDSFLSPPNPAVPSPNDDPSKPTAWEFWLGSGGGNAIAVLTQSSWPTAASVQRSLESIPGIGAGNVKVTAGAIVKDTAPDLSAFDAYQRSVLGPLVNNLTARTYTIEFQGALANKSIESLAVAQHFSFLPSEVPARLTTLLGGSEDGGSGGAPTKEAVPPQYNGDVKAWLKDLQAATDASRYNLLDQAGRDAWVAAINKYFKVLGENPLALIDLQFATALLGGVFPKGPAVTTAVQGEDPAAAQTQELCSQGVIIVTSAAGETAPPPPATPPGTPPPGGSGTAPADLAFAG